MIKMPAPRAASRKQETTSSSIEVDLIKNENRKLMDKNVNLNEQKIQAAALLLEHVSISSSNPTVDVIARRYWRMLQQ